MKATVSPSGRDTLTASNTAAAATPAATPAAPAPAVAATATQRRQQVDGGSVLDGVLLDGSPLASASWCRAGGVAALCSVNGLTHLEAAFVYVVLVPRVRWYDIWNIPRAAQDEQTLSSRDPAPPPTFPPSADPPSAPTHQALCGRGHCVFRDRCRVVSVKAPASF